MEVQGNNVDLEEILVNRTLILMIMKNLGIPEVKADEALEEAREIVKKSLREQLNKN